MSTVLVTGGSGFIGAHLLRRLLADEQHHVVAIGRSQPRTAVPHAFFSADLTSLSRDQLAAVGAVDTVFHLAAATPKVRGEDGDISRMMRDNIEATHRLLAAVPDGVRRFVFASTLDVYRLPPDGGTIDEHTAVEPATVYGAAKACAEHLVRIEGDRRRIPWTILRIGHIFGPGEGAYQKLIPQSIARLLRGQPPQLFGSGNTLRDFLYVADAVEAILRASRGADAAGQIINVVSGCSVTLRETIDALIRVSGRAIEPEHHPGSPDGPSFAFNNERMRRLLGEWPLVPLNRGLQAEYAHESARQP